MQNSTQNISTDIKLYSVKEVASFGGDITQFVPGFVAEKITEKIKEKGEKNNE